MGLDMYLEAELFVGGQYEHRNVQGIVQLEMGSDENRKHIELIGSEVSSITRQIGYWRKANAIHNWFVKYVQAGVDECQRSYVSRDQLRELKCEVERVLDARTAANDSEQAEQVARDILPPAEGFFFGSYAVDKWYYQDMEETIRIIDKALAMPEEYEFYYQSSW